MTKDTQTDEALQIGEDCSVYEAFLGKEHKYCGKYCCQKFK